MVVAKRRSILVLACLLVGAIVLGLAARCLLLSNGGTALTRDVVAGVWKGDGDGQLSFALDGTFEAINLPGILFGPNEASGLRRSGSGSWELVAAIADPDGPLTEIRLVFRQVDGLTGGFAMRVIHDSGDDRHALYCYIGDPDLGRTYSLEKQP